MPSLVPLGKYQYQQFFRLYRQFGVRLLVQEAEIDGELDRNAARAALIAARTAGRSSVECYRAGVELWQRMHPDYALEYAALEAVGIILELGFAEENSAVCGAGSDGAGR